MVNKNKRLNNEVNSPHQKQVHEKKRQNLMWIQNLQSLKDQV
jgi:hypothetical protein